jgi:hypothetical protein
VKQSVSRIPYAPKWEKQERERERVGVGGVILVIDLIFIVFYFKMWPFWIAEVANEPKQDSATPLAVT